MEGRLLYRAFVTLPACLAVSAAMLLLEAGCAASERSATNASATASARPPSAPGPKLTGDVHISGSVSITAPFTAHATVEAGGTPASAGARSTCAYAAGYAQDTQHGGGRGFDPPVLHTATVGQHNLFVSASLPTGYSGPGTYSSGTFVRLAGNAVDELISGPTHTFTRFLSTIHGATTLTVRPDGSGTLEIVDWGSDEDKGGVGTVGIDGAVTWRCAGTS